MFDARCFVHQERNRPAGRLRAGRFELIRVLRINFAARRHLPRPALGCPNAVNVFGRVVHASSRVAAWHASLQRATRARVHPDKLPSKESAGPTRDEQAD